MSEPNKKQETQNPSEEKQQVNLDEELYEKIKQIYTNVKKAIENNKPPKEELKAATKLIDQVIQDDKFFQEKPKSFRLFYGDFISGAGKRLLLQGPIDDFEYLQIIKQLFYKIIDLLRKEIDVDNSDLIDSTRALFQTSRRLYKFQFMTPQQNQIYMKQMMEKRREEQIWRNQLQVGDQIDAVKIDRKVNDVKCWGKAIIEQIKNQYFSITFVDMPTKFDRFIINTSDEIAPLNSKSEEYSWKDDLQQQDNVDVVDPIGTWYNSTILSLTEHKQPAAGNIPEKNYPLAYIGYRVFNEDGKKVDDDGRHFAGWSKKYDEHIPLYSPRIAKFNSKTKYLGRGQSIYQIQKVDDSQDGKTLTDSKGNQLYVMPRKYFTTSSLFLGMFNKLGQSGGFDRILERMRDLDEKTALSFENVFYYTQMISRLTPMFHSNFGSKFLPQFGDAVIQNLMNSEGNKLRSIEGERFDDLVPLLQKILTRFQKQPTDTYIKIDLFNINMALKMLKSDFFNRRIQGFKNINEFTKQLRFYVSRSFKGDYLAKWIKDNQILKEVFSQQRYHLQLIQRSSDLIKFLLLESQITSKQLNLIWSAVNYDQDTRMQVLKLIKQISMQLPVSLCNQITDKIIESSSDIESSSGAVAGKIMDQLLDALFEIAKFAMQKYDYTTKITLHLKRIAQDPKISPERADVALQRYSELLKVWPMSPDRQQVLIKCIDDIAQHRQPLSSFKIIRNIIMNLMTLGKSQHDKYQRAECVQVLVEKFNLMKFFFQDFEYYCTAVQKHLRENLNLYVSNDKDKKTASTLSPNDIKLFDRYPHSEQIKQRLNFLHFILSAWPQYQVTKTQVEKLWEILVLKSLILSDKQAMYKWLKKSCVTQTNQIQMIDINDMTQFFSETMCAKKNNYSNLSIEGFECIKQYFLVVNQRFQKIQRFAEAKGQTHHSIQTSASGYSAMSSDGSKHYQTYSWTRRPGITSALIDQEDESTGVEFKVRVPPGDLKGSEIFWNILLRASSKEVVNKATDFIIRCHQQVDSTLQNESSQILQGLVMEALQTIKKTAEANEQSEQGSNPQNVITRLLNLLKILLLQAQKSAGNGGVKPHSAILKGQLLKLTVNNSVYYKRNIPRKLEFHLYSNTTIWQLRNRIARINGISPEMIRIIKAPAREVKDSENAKTLQQMKIQSGQIVIASKRSVQNLPKANLVTAGNELTPAARSIFLQWFEKYQDKPGLLTSVGLANFTKNCTQDQCSPNDKRILAVFDQYDIDKDGGLNQKQFLEFYRDSSVQRPKVVWNNILNHGYRRDLKKREEAEKDSNSMNNEISMLPRFSIANNSQHFKIIFDLLSYKKGKVAKEAWDLINQLITSPHLYQKMLHLQDMNESMNWEDLLDANSTIYKLLYSLQIIESFLQENKGKAAQKMFFIEEQRKKNNEGKEEKIEIKNQITFEPNGSVNFHQKNKKDNQGQEQDQKEVQKHPSKEQEEEETLQKLLVDWRLAFVQKGGITYLLKLFLESGEGKNVLKIKDDMDRNQKKCLGFVLRILKLYIISAYCSKDQSAYNLVFERQASTDVSQDKPKQKDEKPKDPTSSAPTGFIGPLSKSHYNAMEDTYSITQSLIFDDNDIAEASGSGLSSSQYETSKKKSMTSKQGRQLVGQIRGAIAEEMLLSIDFKQLQKILLEAVVLILTKKVVELDDTKTIQNALNLWLVCMLNQAELIQEFYDFKGVQVHRQQVDGVEKVTHSQLDCCGLIQCGLFCFKSLSIRQEFQSTILYIASKIDVKEKHTNQLPLSVIINKLLKLLPREYKQQTKQCKQYFSLLCELLDLCFEKQQKQGGQQEAGAFNPLNLANLSVQSLINHKSNEKRNSIFEDKALIGYINLTNKLLNHIDSSRISEINQKYHLSQQLFSKCLFAQYKELPEGVQLTAQSDINLQEMTPNKCKTKQSRAAAYNLLSTVVKNDVHSLNSLVHDCLLELTDKIKVRNSWAYTPASASRSIHGYSGLRNLGCICYMLAMLQQFYMVPSFRYQLMRVNDGLPQDIVEYKKHLIDDNILHQLQKLLAFMELTEREDFNPFDFCFSCKDIQGNPTQLGVQQDAQEFLNVFFDRIENALRPTPYKYLLFSVFGGKNCNQCICQNCGNITRRVEDFYNLSLEVRHCKTIYDSLEKYVAGERIDDYFCEACKQKATVVKRTCLSQLPNVLIVHLQRITLDYDTFQNVKINTRLEFPTKLELKPYMESSLLKRDQHQKQEKAAEEQQQNQEDQSEDQSQNVKDNDDEGETPNLEKQKSSNVAKQKQQNDKKQQNDDENEDDDLAQYEFKLVGVVIQIGTADAGHYYSYINTKRGSKNDENSPQYMNTQKEKWLEFNDSHVRDFKFSTLDSECFGGESKSQNNDTVAGDIFSHWAMRGYGGSRENCKNAYMLVYEKHRKQTIKLIVEQDQKQKAQSINTSTTEATEALDRADPTVTRDNNKDQEADTDAAPPPPSQSGELQPNNLETFFDQQKKEHYQQLPFNSITKYVPHHLYKAVWDDNNQFLFEKQIYAKQYFAFLRDVLTAVKDQIKKPDTPEDIRQILSEDMVKIGSKMVLEVLSRAYSNEPITKISEVLLEIYKQNQSSARKFLSQLLQDEGFIFTKLMFGCPDKNVRECVAKLTTACLNLIFKKELEILNEQEQWFEEQQQQPSQESEVTQKKEKKSLGIFPKALSVRFLDFMQAIVRGDCHKHWTRFEQFFGIYKQFAMGGQEQLQFLLKRELLSTLTDFMLGNSSPLKVLGEKRPLMGSRYMTPVFDPIVQVVSYMAIHSYTDSFYKRKIIGKDSNNEPIYDQEEHLAHNEKVFKGDYNNAHQLSFNELMCLRSSAFVQKCLKENQDPRSLSKFIAHFSYNNYDYSLQIARIILTGINQADYQEIVPYLESISEFLLINDCYRFLRLEWLLGISLPSTGRLNIQLSRFGLSMLDSSDDQITNYYSPLMYDNNNDSILTLLWRSHKKWDTYAMKCLNTLLTLMVESEDIFDWIFNAGPPVIQYARYSDWFQQFNSNYIQDLKKYQSTYSTKRQQMAQASSKMLEEINQKIADRVEQNRKVYDGPEIKPLKITYTQQTENNEEKKVVEDVKFIQNYPPNYILGDTIEQKLLHKFQKDGIAVRIYEIYTNVYYSRPDGQSSTTVGQEYFRVKKEKKDLESKFKTVGRQMTVRTQQHAKANVGTPAKEQKIEQDISPLGVESDEQPQIASETEPLKGSSDTDSGQNIMKLTKTKQQSTEPNISVVQPQPQSKETAQAYQNIAEETYNEYNYIYEQSVVVSSVLKFTVHNTTDKPLKSVLKILPIQGKEANFYIPMSELRTKIKPASLRVAVFIQKRDINKTWGDYSVALQVHQMDTGSRGLSKAIGPVDQLKSSNQINLNIGVIGDTDEMDDYDGDSQSMFFNKGDDNKSDTDSNYSLE